jgi:hypothetical protein
MVQIIYIHMYVNVKMRSVETVPGKGRGRKRSVKGVNSCMIWYIVRTFVNATVYPNPAQQ